MTRPALAPSLQKTGAAVSASLSAIDRSIEAESKTPPDVQDLPAERGDGARDFIDHAVPPK
jgi:hypothetical protein